MKLFNKITSLFFFLSIFSTYLFSQGQVLVFHKSTREYWFHRNMNVTFITENDGKLKGRIDTFTVKNITITTETKGQITLNTKEIKAFRSCGAWFRWGATHSIGWLCRRINLNGYFAKIKIINSPT